MRILNKLNTSNCLTNNRLMVCVLFACYALMLANNMFSQVKILGGFVSQLFSLSLIALLLVCVINLMKAGCRKALLLLLISFALITKFILDSNIILFWCLFVIAFRGIKFDDVVKYDIVIRLVFLAVVGILYFNGLTNTNIHYRDGILRHSMGLSNPNVFSIHVTLLVSEFLYLSRKRVGFLSLVAVLVGEFVIWYFARSKTEMFILAGVYISLFLVYLWKRGKMRNIIPSFLRNCIKLFTIYAFVIFTIFSAIIAISYDPSNSMMSRIDVELAGRLSRAHNLVDEIGITPFGYKVDGAESDRTEGGVSNHSLSLDNAYLYILLSYGVTGSFAMSYIMRNYFKYTLAKRNYAIVAIMLVFLFGGIFERSCISLHFNTFLMYFSYALFIDPNDKIFDSNKTETTRRLNAKSH